MTNKFLNKRGMFKQKDTELKDVAIHSEDESVINTSSSPHIRFRPMWTDLFDVIQNWDVSSLQMLIQYR